MPTPDRGCHEGAVARTREEHLVQTTRALSNAPLSERILPIGLPTRGRRPAWSLAHVVSDLLLLWLVFWLAYTLRYGIEIGGDIHPRNWEPFGTFARTAWSFVVVSLAVFSLRRIYLLPRSTSFLDEASLVIGGVTTAMAVVVLASYFLRFNPSRLVFLYAWLGAIALLLIKRVAIRRLRARLWTAGIGVDRVLVVGAGQAGRLVMGALAGQSSLGYRLVGYADGDAEERIGVATEAGVTWTKRLGSIDDVPEIVHRERIDEVIVALPAEEHDRVVRIVEACRAESVTYKIVPDLLQLSLDRVDLEEIAGVPLIGFQTATIRGWDYAVKRAMDVVIAAAVLASGAIPMALIVCAIKLDSPGPILCRQRRIGRNGRPFTCLKFRSMFQDAEDRRDDLIGANGTTDRRLFKLRDDPRRTRVGKVLRRWSLDELPQFWHVFRGEMSVVGPRPPLPQETEDYEPWHRQRLEITPGLTGLWQINGRSDLTFDEMVRLDLYYAEHWSPWLDVKIVLRTVPAVLTGRGAY